MRRKIAASDPQNPVYAYRLGKLLIDAGAAEEGREQVARALSLDTGFATLLRPRHCSGAIDAVCGPFIVTTR